jgi:hypothetical protein
MQATAVAGTKPGGGLEPPLPRMQIAGERGLAIDRIDRRVVSFETLTDAGVSPDRVERLHHLVFGVAAALTRTAVMVVLASLAILVLLPAAIAAQATSAF